MEAKLTELNLYEALRYMGCQGAEVPPELFGQVEKAAAAVTAAAEPRLIARDFALEGMAVAGTALRLAGADLAALLSGCGRVILLAATLGAEVERLLTRASLTDPAWALVLDACASTAVENLCDNAERELKAHWKERGFYLTDRFSPGYGDVPLALQRDFCAVLDTGRRMGLCVSASGIMIPRKSVTALMGVSPVPVAHRPKGCAVCALRETCAFRKKGHTCGA